MNLALLPGRYISPRVCDSNRWTVRMTDMSLASHWDATKRVSLISVCHSVWIRHFFFNFQDFPCCTPFGVFKSLQNHGLKTLVWEWANICSSSELSLCLIFILDFEWTNVCPSSELSICLIFIHDLEWANICPYPELSDGRLGVCLTFEFNLCVCLVCIGNRLWSVRRLPDFRV